MAIFLTSSVILTWCLWGPVVEKGTRRILLNIDGIQLNVKIGSIKILSIVI